MAHASPEHLSDAGSSSDLYGTPQSLDHDPPTRPPSGKRKSQALDANEALLKRVRLESPHGPSIPASSSSKAAANGHSRPVPRPMSRPHSTHPLPGTWNLSRPASVASLVNLPGPSVSANPTNPRNQQEGNERKAARKADIERRCRELDPPLLPNVLSRMSTFDAATQIGRPFDDQDWENLKPKLLAERLSVEKIVHEEERVIAQAQVDLLVRERDEHEEVSSEPRVSLKDAKDAEAREWAAIQAPTRNRLGSIADAFIRDDWADGRRVTFENSPQFAADCLIQIRRKYYSNTAHDPDSAPGSLVLDAMKWVYDHKVKPIAEKHRKDLFLCNECDAGMKAFEGCIQHFAAKHTSSFSAGMQIVAWHSALWPESPPFAPDPLETRPNVQPSWPGYPGGQYHTPHPHPSQPKYPPPPFPPPLYAAHHHPMPPGHQTSPGPYGNPAYADQYQYYVHGPYGAPPFPGHLPPTSPTTGQYPFHQSPAPYTPGSSHGWPPPPYPHMYSPPSPGYSYPPPGPTNPGPMAYGSGPAPASHWNTAPGAPGQNLYQAQRDEFSRTANEIWSSISDVKDIPPSVRVYTVLYQAVSLFRSRFKNEPSLDLVLDCVISSPLIAALKNATGLACKTCVLSNEDLEEPHATAFQFRSGGRTLYPFHSLLQHFKKVHVEREISRKSPPNGNPESPLRLDWKEDMIELPENALIAGLANTRNMDHHKLRVLAGAFPVIFPSHAPGQVSTASTDSLGNEYDPRNPLMIPSGQRPHSREGSPGLARHLSIQSGNMQPLSKRTRHSTQGINPSIVKLEDGKDYQLVRVGPHVDAHLRGSTSRHLHLASNHGHDSSSNTEEAMHSLETLEMEPRYRGGEQYSHPLPYREMIYAGSPEEYRDPRSFSTTRRTSYYDDAQNRPVEYVYMPPPPPPPPRASYTGNPRDHQYESPYDGTPHAHRDGQIHGASRRRYADRF